MAYDFNGTNQYLSATAPINGNTKPFTMACWFNSDSVTTAQYLVSLCATNGGAYALSAHGTVSGDPIYAITTNGTVAQSTTGYTANTWNHACGIFRSNTSKTVYLNGGSSATNTNTDGVPGAATNIHIGVTRFFGNFVAYLDGRIAEVGVWDVELTAAEIASLAKGMTCDKVRPQNLQFYAPLCRNLIDLKGRTITNNNTATVANHPRVYA